MIRAGMISTTAGIGDPGYSGDCGDASRASLCEPKSLALDGKGHLFIADSENHVIRCVNLATGRIETVAGFGTDAAHIQGESVVGSDEGQDGDPFVETEQGDGQRYVQRADASGTVRFLVGQALGDRCQGDGGPAREARLNFPSAVVADAAGNLYIADTFNHRVRRVDAATGLITTIIGTGQKRFGGDGGAGVRAALNEPVALVLDNNERLYVADQGNHRVRRLDLATGQIVTVVGTGEAGYNGDNIPGEEAALAGPSGLAIDPDGGLYIADTFNGRIRRLDLTSGTVVTVAGDGGSYRYQGEETECSMSLSRPHGIAVESDGNLLITDSDSHLIRRWDGRRKLVTRVAGNGEAGFCGDGGSPLSCRLNYPFGVAVDGLGTIYIADTFNHRIRKITAVS